MLFWTKDEYLKFADTMMDKTLSYYAFEMLYWCGIRLGELLALTAEDFDFENQTVTISKFYQRIKGKDVITDPKTKKSNRTIKMPKFLCEEMQDYLKMLYDVVLDDRMFPVTKSYPNHEIAFEEYKPNILDKNDVKEFKPTVLSKEQANKAELNALHSVDKTVESGIIKLDSVKDFNCIKSYFKQKNDIVVNDFIDTLDYETCKKTLEGFESVCIEYPELSNRIKKIKISRDGVMSCTGDTINFNPVYFKPSNELNKICKEQSERGFWIRNASPDSLMVHECGHAIESLLIEANSNY